MKKKLVAGLASAGLAVSALSPAAFAANFNDVQGTPFQGSVNLLKALNIVSGDTDGNYHPYSTITRAEMAKILVETAGLDAKAQQYGNAAVTGFNDVDGTGFGWAAGYIKAAREAGLINGVDQWNFKPGDNVTTEEALAMVMRLLGLSDSSVGGYYQGYLNKANALGLIDSNFTVGTAASRGLIAQLDAKVLDQNVVGGNKTLLSQNFTSIPGTTSVSGAVYAASANTITVGGSVYNVTGDSNVAASLASLVGHNVTVAVDANGNVVNLVDAGAAASAVKSVSISGNNTVAVGQSEKLVAVGQDANGNAVSLPGSVSATWSVSGSGAQVDANGNFIASAAGTYTVTATINGVSATANVVVYGQAAGIVLTGNQNVVADGSSKSTITAKVVDTVGNTVYNFNGSFTIGKTAASLGVNLPSNTTVNINNGVGTFVVTSNDSNVGETTTLTTSAVSSSNGQNVANNFSFGTLTLTTVAPTVASVSVSATKPALSVGSGNDSTTLTVKVLDNAGVQTAVQPQYVTLTLTGPGSFSSTSSVTTKTIYVSGSDSSTTVYGTQGVPGNIVVTATATGITSGSLTIPTYVNTAAASLKLTSSTGTDNTNNSQFTLYTLQLVDTNGNPITNVNGVSVSDVISYTDTSGGKLTYKFYDPTTQQPTAATPPTSLTYGQMQIAVENTGTSSTAPTITFTDTANNFQSTVTYSYTVGVPYTVSVSMGSSSSAELKAGQTATVTATLKDSNGNTVNKAGQLVNFQFVTNSALAAFPNNNVIYQGTTDSNGNATVAVTVPSNASVGNSFQVSAQINGSSQSAVNSATYTVVSPTNYVNSLKITSGFPANNQLTVGVDTVNGAIEEDNALGVSAGSVNDQLKVSVSDTSILAISGTTSSNTTLAAGVTTLPAITGKKAGSATITVTDVSNPDQPSISRTVTVVPGAYSSEQVQYNGSAVSSSNKVTVGANSPVALQIVHADAGGNPVPVVGADQVVTLSDGVAGGQFSLTAGGLAINQVTIPAGSTSVTVYYQNPSAGSYTTFSATNLTPGLVLSSSNTAPVAGSSFNLSITVTDQNGRTLTSYNGYKPVTVSGQAAAVGDGTFGTFNGTTLTAGPQIINANFVNGSAVVPVSLNKVASQTLTITANGASNTVTEGVVNIAAPVVTNATTAVINAANKAAYTVTGTGVAGATVTASVGSATGTATVASNGTWTATVNATAVADGSVAITATQSDVHGNGASAVSNTVTVTKDTVAPVASTVTFADGNATAGFDATDTIAIAFSKAVNPATLGVTGLTAGGAAVTGQSLATILGATGTIGSFATTAPAGTASIALSADGKTLTITVTTATTAPAGNFTPNAAIKDLAGNVITTTPATPTGTF